MKTFKIVLTFLGLLVLASCAHHRDVRPGVDGINHVMVRETTREEAERSAIKQANHFCKDSNRMAAFMEEKTQYTGSMNESTRDTVRKAMPERWALS